MRFIGPMMTVTVLLAVDSLQAQDAVDRPYAAIVSRNMFGLVPIPPPAPPESTNEVDPPPKITVNGIMSIFGKMQVLFKAMPKAKAGQPAVEDSYMMSEGERQDEIEVTKIDDQTGTVTFNNHGIEQTLTMELAKGATGGTPTGGPGGGPAGMPGMRSGMGVRPGGSIGGMGMPPVNPNGIPPNANNSNMPGFGGASVSTGNNQAAVQMTPEAQVLAIEAQRQIFKAEGNPIANILPPTPVTKQLEDEAANASNQ